jgi:hypothetical protein
MNKDGVEQSFSIVLPLRKKARIDPGDLITELRLFVEATGATVRMDPRMIHQQPAQRGGLFSSFRQQPPEVTAFELDGVRLRVAMHAEPFADRNEIGKYVNPVKWDRGLGEFTDHRAYFRVYEAGIEGEDGPDAVFDRAASVTATASVVSKLSEPVGAIWVAARNSLPMRAFHQAMAELQEGRAPLSFWLRWHVIPPGEMEDLNSGLITGGLAPFTGHEILAKPSTAETRDMIDHALEVARRMVDEKLAVTDGQTVEGRAGVPLRVRLGGRHRKGEAPACEIALVDPPAARPRPREDEVDPLGLGTGAGLPGMPLPAGVEGAETPRAGAPVPPTEAAGAARAGETRPPAEAAPETRPAAGGAPEPGPEDAPPDSGARPGRRVIRLARGGS